jgi:hypothetical protein
VLAQGIDSNSIRFQQIPSILRCIPDALPWDVRANFHIHDFGMDPAQDLLVLLEVVALGDSILYPASSRIHLVSLIDGKPHQRATSTVLEYTPPYFSLIWTYTVQTQGDFLGLLYHAPETLPPRATSRVVIWNWRTGILFADHFSHAIESFAFLDERRLLLGRILRTREDTDPAVGWKTPSLDIYTFRTTDEQPMPHHKALHLVSLSYPTLFPGASALGMVIRTDPAPRWTPPSTQALPFNLNGQERMIIIRFWILSGRRAHPLVHYVLRSALISQVDQSKDHASEMPSRVEWDHWGPDTSRLLTNEPMDDSWVCYVYGMRLITAHVRRQRENVRNFDLKVTLRDFHGLAIRHDLGMEDLCDHNDLLGTSVALAGSICAAEPAHHHWRYRVEEIHDTVIHENEELFDKDVITTLPYREVSRVLPQEVYSGGKTAVMLSEDAILVVDLKVRSIKSKLRSTYHIACRIRPLVMSGTLHCSHSDSKVPKAT